MSSVKEAGRVPRRGSSEGGAHQGWGSWDRSLNSGVSERAYKKLYIPVLLILAQDSSNSTFK